MDPVSAGASVIAFITLAGRLEKLSQIIQDIKGAGYKDADGLLQLMNDPVFASCQDFMRKYASKKLSRINATKLASKVSKLDDCNAAIDHCYDLIKGSSAAAIFRVEGKMFVTPPPPNNK
jgi:hypothetical protein